MEIKLLPPSINKSHYSFHVENGAIRYCLSAIRGVGVNALKEIFQARRIKPFRDLFDLCLRVSLKTINRKTLESLIYSGALDEFDQDRAVLLASLDVAIEHAQLMQPLDSTQTDLFSDDEFIIKPKYFEVDPLTIENKLTLEKEVLGLFLSDHPMVAFKKQLHAAGATPLAELHKGSKQVVAGVYINDVKKIRTKKGDSMAFLSVSDQSGETEAVVFPDVYKRIANNLQQGTMIVIEGNIEERAGKIQFIIKNGKDISEYLLKMYKSTLYLRIELSKQTPEHLQQLKVLVNQHSGDINVVLHYEGSEKNVLLSDDDRINGSEKCIGELKDFLGNDNVILKK
jgi:DNA polymerase-3 subunit alpha